MGSPEYPQYWLHDGRPGVLVERTGRNPIPWVLDPVSGEFKLRHEYLVDIQHKASPREDRVDREEFIQAVEEIRGERAVLWRQGPQVSDALRAVYETILAIVGPPSNRKRSVTDEERALVRVLRKRTFEMFEAELRERGGVGMPG